MATPRAQSANPEAPGLLAELEAQWLKDAKGVDITPEQVRAVLNYHGEFRRQSRDEREAERLRKAKERAEKAAARVVALEAKANGKK